MSNPQQILDQSFLVAGQSTPPFGGSVIVLPPNAPKYVPKERQSPCPFAPLSHTFIVSA